MKKYLATILMPVYNGSDYLEASIKSILSQTYADFEFLILNDGSTDNSEEIIKSFLDRRINYQKNASNMGLSKSLNRGIDLATGDYIIRMDSDDISSETRVEKQIEFMVNNPSIGLSGSLFSTFGEYKKTYIVPTENDIIKLALLQRNVIAHPTVIFRKSDFLKNGLTYDENYLMCEDYELWSRAIRYIKVANIGELLVHYRKHARQTSKRLSLLKEKYDLKIKVNQLSFLTGKSDTTMLNLYEKLFQVKVTITEAEHNSLIEDILESNNSKKIYNQELLKSFLYSNFLVSYNEI